MGHLFYFINMYHKICGVQCRFGMCWWNAIFLTYL